MDQISEAQWRFMKSVSPKLAEDFLKKKKVKLPQKKNLHPKHGQQKGKK